MVFKKFFLGAVLSAALTWVLPVTAQASPLIGANQAIQAALEVGADDFRISHMGLDGESDNDANFPSIAYNSQDNEYLVVWQGNEADPLIVGVETEIFGQRIDAATGDSIGDQFRISDMGPDEDQNFAANNPRVAYNATENEYLVVWSGDDDTGSLDDNEFEVFGQRLDAATGAELGENDFRISHMGPDSNTAFSAAEPSVAYNVTNDEYLVVWYGDDPVNENEYEIFGQRLDATGTEVGDDDFQISDIGPDENDNYSALYPGVAYNITNNEYLVTWIGDDAVNDQFEIYGQRLNAATGAEVGDNDFQISNMGPAGAVSIYLSSYSITPAYNATRNEYLVLWAGEAVVVGGEGEVFGQRLDAATGDEIGNDFQVSDQGPSGDNNFYAAIPTAAYNAVAHEYLVTWYGDTSVNDEFEIFARRLDADTGVVVGDGFQVSDTGLDGSVAFVAFYPQVAYNPSLNQYLVVWTADDDTTPLVDEEFEIYGQRLSFPVCGNGVVESSGSEECDDGNTVDGDCCSSTCTFEAAAVSCDDGDAGTTGDQCDGAGVCEGTAIVSAGPGGGCSLIR